jgi:hypothetical protein
MIENSDEKEDAVFGKITDFVAGVGSGLATISLEGIPVLCENCSTIRALDEAFGDVILPNHSVNLQQIVGKYVVYSVGEFGLLDWVRPFNPDSDSEEPRNSSSCERRFQCSRTSL